MARKDSVQPCPCGGLDYAACCGPYLAGAAAPTAALLMRSRYTAYVLRDEGYLAATWHASTRPAGPVTEPGLTWLGLEVRGYAVDAQDPSRATVEFVARCKDGGRAHRLHEVSNFVREAAPGGPRWYYVDGTFPEKSK